MVLTGPKGDKGDSAAMASSSPPDGKLKVELFTLLARLSFMPCHFYITFTLPSHMRLCLITTLIADAALCPYVCLVAYFPKASLSLAQSHHLPSAFRSSLRL